MRKLLLLGSLLATMAGQAQETTGVTYYWPGERVIELQSGTQYFIYNTTFLDKDGTDTDRSFFLYSNGSALKTTDETPKNFATDSNKYLFTLEKNDQTTAENQWTMRCVDGIVGHGGQTNNTNTDIRTMFIYYWYKNSGNLFTGAKVNSEPEDGGATVDPDKTDTKTWAITGISGLNPEVGLEAGRDYAWNGNADDQPAFVGNQWARWDNAHPYAFYTVESKTVEHVQEQTNRNGLISNTAFNLQKAYGLVQDGDKYYCNYPTSVAGENSSYANLIDGNDNTKFHTGYNKNDGGESTDKHYLRAELPEAKNAFYFITKRRTDNNANRPTTILIEGSNDGSKYEEITTVSGLPTDANEYFYFSGKISASTAYKYIRFTPTVISGDTKFFTYSEFYVIESNKETDKIMTDISNFRNYDILGNIKNEDVATEFKSLYQTVVDDNEPLNFKIRTQEAQNLLDANASNHSTTPELGQYPTEAYNTFEAAVSTAQNSDKLAAAIKTFKFSINAPVFTINGTYVGSGENNYNTTGKSIYYAANDASYPWRWDKATNKYDKTMLWKFAGSTSNMAEAGKSYTAMNMAEDVYFWNAEQINVKATNPTNENGTILIYTAGDERTIHADRYGYTLHYNAVEPTSASGWTITYVGESFDIDQIDEEKLAAYATLKTLVSECEPYKGHIGSGLNQFSCEGHDFEKALADAKMITDQDIYQNHELDARPALAALQAAKNALAINQPAAGKFYRFKSATQKNYIASNQVGKDNRPLMTDKPEDAVFYLTADNKLVTSSLLTMDGYSVVANLGKATTFKASNATIGTYIIRNNNFSYYAKATGELLDRWGNESESINQQANCAWIIEEVSDAAQQPKLTKTMTAEYATLAAPVALNIPADVKAYTVTVDETKETAILNEVAEIIPAGVAVLLKKEGAASNFDFTYAPEGATDNENDLVGVYQETAVGDVNAYILGNVEGTIGFYQMASDDRTLGANKAYLVLPKEAQAIRSIVIGGPTTGIEETVAEGAEAEEYYDLQGRRVMNPTKGIYVTKSGKKVIFNK